MEKMLCEIEFDDGVNILKEGWRWKNIGKHKQHRIYYNPKEDRSGFDFICLEWVARDYWNEDTEVEIMFSGECKQLLKI